MPLWNSPRRRPEAVELASESGGSSASSSPLRESSHFAASVDQRQKQSGRRGVSPRRAGGAARAGGFSGRSAEAGSSPSAERSVPPLRAPSTDTLDSNVRPGLRYSGRLGFSQPPSGRSSCNGSLAFTTRNLALRDTTNVLVLGAPQTGKSLLINSYRAAVTNTNKWPAAPVGISGFYGTTTVMPFPDHPLAPAWLCIDTPGRIYTTETEVLLEKLVEGMPWKTKLAGTHALSIGEVANLATVPANRAHQCIIVLAATDLIMDLGWMSIFRWRSRYGAAGEVGSVVLYTKWLVSLIRTVMNDVSPYVVVTKMDKFGGAGNGAACAAIRSLLEQCVPGNRIYFTSSVQDRGSLAAGRSSIVLDYSTKQNLVRLHQEMSLSMEWSDRVTSVI